MPGAMKLGPTTLRVIDLRSVLGFYENYLGFHVIRKYKDASDDLNVVELGFAPSTGDYSPLLILKHDPEAKESGPNSAGLYHYALRVPDRKSLASTYLAAGSAGANFEGFADHLVSESLYLKDIERNGIEIYVDRPRNVWPDWKKLSEAAKVSGDYRPMVAALGRPLDFNSLLSELTKDQREAPSPFPSGATTGHVHLRVTDLERSVKFYHEKLGLDIMMDIPKMGAAFLSAGGYHHHVGLNTWESLGGSKHEEGSEGLDEFTIVVPNMETLDQLQSQFPDIKPVGDILSVLDPDNNRLSIEVVKSR